MNKKILQRLIPSQIPERFSKLLCSTAVPSQINKTLSLENFRRHGATPRFYLYVVNIKLLKLFRKPVVLLCDILMLYS